MTDIPQDIKLAAQLALDGVTAFPDGTYTDEAYNIIASAILAERLRCADIAGKEGDEYRDHGLPHCALGAFQVQKAILAGETA